MTSAASFSKEASTYMPGLRRICGFGAWIRAVKLRFCGSTEGCAKLTAPSIEFHNDLLVGNINEGWRKLTTPSMELPVRAGALIFTRCPVRGRGGSESKMSAWIQTVVRSTI